MLKSKGHHYRSICLRILRYKRSSPVFFPRMSTDSIQSVLNIPDNRLNLTPDKCFMKAERDPLN